MARRRGGRRPGAHFECDFLNDPRVIDMTPADWTVYSKLWILAVDERTEVIDRLRWSDRQLARKFAIDRRALAKSLRKCSTTLGLIGATEESIIVYGVKDMHDKMEWNNWDKSVPVTSPPPEPVSVSAPVSTPTPAENWCVCPDEITNEGWRKIVAPVVQQLIPPTRHSQEHLLLWCKATMRATSAEKARAAVRAFVANRDPDASGPPKVPEFKKWVQWDQY